VSKVAIVTGGSRGIGAAISVGLKDAGFTVAANFAGNVEKANTFKEATGIAVYRFDVSDPQACADGIAQIVSDLGPVSVLVNNAGITRDGMLHKMDYETWSTVIRTNLDSMFNMTRPVIEGMRAQNYGRIVNISSINGQKGQMGQTNYSAAKAGVIGFTKALAQETARKGITVNCICPGYVNTEMVAALPEKVLQSIVATIPIGRLGESDEIASMVTYLASEQAAFVTGAVMTVNGGQYIANG
jgi:acetoacetyl-CoA reductase